MLINNDNHKEDKISYYFLNWIYLYINVKMLIKMRKI